MPVAPSSAVVRWFADTRVEILVAADAASVVRSRAEQGNMPPLHVHVDHDETFYVLDGELSLHVGGEARTLGPGEAAFAPRGVPHTYRVESDAGSSWIVVTTSRAFADFVAATSTPATDAGYAPPERRTSPDVLAAVAASHGIEILGPPGALPG